MEDEEGGPAPRKRLSQSRRETISGTCISESATSVSENTDFSRSLKRKADDYTIPRTSKKAKSGLNMLNGYRSSDVQQRALDEPCNSERVCVATLSNMGNTCYLNSVLYTLRFAPSFLHNLHHLVADLAYMHTKINQTKAKSSSLGRNIGSITGPSSRSSSSKDLLSLGNAQNDLHPKTKMQIATEKLHELYMSLHILEMKDSNDPYQPASFLQALIDVNSIYQGNQQQDAHELLIYLLDILRETCDLLAKQAEHQSDLQAEPPLVAAATAAAAAVTKSRSMRHSWKKVTKKADKSIKDKDKEKQIREDEQVNSRNTHDSDSQCTTGHGHAHVDKLAKKMGLNFVCEDYGGIALRRTKCLECESVTERKEPFYDICVPVHSKDADADLDSMHPSELYRTTCVTTEYLRDTNKYWCENCLRYNEACREVSYERLPNLLVLQLKRFSTSAGGTEKMNNYMPTPLELSCFCDRCTKPEHDTKLHTYELYGVIMHLGATMASGHYIAYTRASDHHYEYMHCCRDNKKRVPFTSGASEKSTNILKFFKSLNSGSGSSSDNVKTHVNNASSKNEPVNGISNCKSMDCCGIKLSKSVIENVLNQSVRESRAARATYEPVSWPADSDYVWFECDDDVVRTLSTKDFEKLLSYKRNSPATPYLLFYSRVQDNSLFCNIHD